MKKIIIIVILLLLPAIYYFSLRPKESSEQIKDIPAQKNEIAQQKEECIEKTVFSNGYYLCAYEIKNEYSAIEWEKLIKNSKVIADYISEYSLSPDKNKLIIAKVDESALDSVKDSVGGDRPNDITLVNLNTDEIVLLQDSILSSKITYDPKIKNWSDDSEFFVFGIGMYSLEGEYFDKATVAICDTKCKIIATDLFQAIGADTPYFENDKVFYHDTDFNLKSINY